MSEAGANRHVARRAPKSAVEAGRSRAAWWTKLVHFVAATAGLLGPGIGAEASPAGLESDSYRAATAAPAAWQVFAGQLRGRIEQRLAGDDDRARHFQQLLAGHEGGTDAPVLTFVLRTWIRADGKVSRVEFDGLDDPDAIGELRALLVDGDVGVPPPEMLQPLHLRLSLRAKDPSERRE